MLEWLREQVLAGDLVSALVIPAMVAAVVTLAFEILFKPALEVRKDRRVAADQALRRAADALRRAASRLHVISTMGQHNVRYGLKLLWDETERLESQLDEAREELVTAPQTTRTISVLASHGLGRGKAAAIALRDDQSRDIITSRASAPLGELISLPVEDLLRAHDELSTAADFMDAPWRHLVRRARLLLAARELVAKAQREVEESDRPRPEPQP